MPVSRTIDGRSRIVADSVAVSGAEASRLSRATERPMMGLLSSRWVSLNRFFLRPLAGRALTAQVLLQKSCSISPLFQNWRGTLVRQQPLALWRDPALISFESTVSSSDAVGSYVIGPLPFPGIVPMRDRPRDQAGHGLLTTNDVTGR
jgi:hypothetical protein